MVVLPLMLWVTTTGILTPVIYLYDFWYSFDPSLRLRNCMGGSYYQAFSAFERVVNHSLDWLFPFVHSGCQFVRDL